LLYGCRRHNDTLLKQSIPTTHPTPLLLAISRSTLCCTAYRCRRHQRHVVQAIYPNYSPNNPQLLAMEIKHTSINATKIIEYSAVTYSSLSPSSNVELRSQTHIAKLANVFFPLRSALRHTKNVTLYLLALRRCEQLRRLELSKGQSGPVVSNLLSV
jgi:hypothetical protein